MSALWFRIALLLGSAVVIYLACEFFVNDVEWVGQKMDSARRPPAPSSPPLARRCLKAW